MSFLIEHWYVIFLLVVLCVSIYFNVRNFIQLPKDEQKEKVREWLIWAVVLAEKELGGGTGQLKLRKVYGMFIESFPWLVQVITFTEFSEMVDTALEKMKEMLQNNEKVKEFVEANPGVELADLLSAIERIAGRQIEMEEK